MFNFFSVWLYKNKWATHWHVCWFVYVWIVLCTQFNQKCCVVTKSATHWLQTSSQETKTTNCHEYIKSTSFNVGYLSFSTIRLFKIYGFFFNSGTTTVIHRPHGDSMLIIRPSVNKNKPLQTTDKPISKKPIVAQTTSLSLNSFDSANVITDLDTASSSTSGKYFFLFKFSLDSLSPTLMIIFRIKIWIIYLKNFLVITKKHLNTFNVK